MNRSRLRLVCGGVVQGVGLRPRLARLATALGLVGSVANVRGGVRIDLQGERPALESFLARLPQELPAAARLEPLRPRWLAPRWPAPRGVQLVAAAPRPLGVGLVAPSLCADRAPCAACLAELADPADRRHGYAFLSCSDCGPRYSIATAEPYARAHTTLAAFPLCPACRAEFEDPADRRFHAETIGCALCGPRLQLLTAEGTAAAADGDPLEAAVTLLEAGRILALQGVGGFQLLVAADDDGAVARLRHRKRRPARPFALLVGEESGLSPWLRISAAEREALQGPAAPIVLLQRRFSASDPWGQVAPGCPCLGVMRPASPLHHLLVQRFGRALVATSGNRSGEPLCLAPAEALERLAGIADAFLVHDRPIARALDDSVLQIIEGRPALLRRARGFAPQPLPLPLPPGPPLLALGGDLKNAPALAQGGRLWLAPHQGDLDDGRLLERLQQGLSELEGKVKTPPLAAVACDAHPDYRSHQLAHGRGLPCHRVGHHLAHALAVAAEHGLKPPLLAFCADGLGYGEGEGEALRGSELLWIDTGSCRRLAALRPFPLPGGERASREPRRVALGLLHNADLLAHPGAAAVEAAFSAADRALLLQALAGSCNSPHGSSLGRLFDAVASLLGLAQVLSYEGEGGLRVQGAAEQAGEFAGGYPLPLIQDSAATDAAGGLPLGRLDWEPLLRCLLAEIAAGEGVAVCAARFHRGLASGIAEALATASSAAAAAAAAAAASDCRQVVLGGGCFQNRLLLELCLAELRARGLQPFWPQAVPAGDGGLAVGQVLALRPPWRGSAPT